MSTKKYSTGFCNGKKNTPSLHLRKCIKMRSFWSFPVLLCSRHGCRIRSKLSKIIEGGVSCVDGRARRVSLAVPLRHVTLRSARREAGQFEVYNTEICNNHQIARMQIGCNSGLLIILSKTNHTVETTVAHVHSITPRKNRD